MLETNSETSQPLLIEGSSSTGGNLEKLQHIMNLSNFLTIVQWSRNLVVPLSVDTKSQIPSSWDPYVSFFHIFQQGWYSLHRQPYRWWTRDRRKKIKFLFLSLLYLWSLFTHFTGIMPCFCLLRYAMLDSSQYTYNIHTILILMTKPHKYNCPVYPCLWCYTIITRYGVMMIKYISTPGPPATD